MSSVKICEMESYSAEGGFTCLVDQMDNGIEIKKEVMCSEDDLFVEISSMHPLNVKKEQVSPAGKRMVKKSVEKQSSSLSVAGSASRNNTKKNKRIATPSSQQVFLSGGSLIKNDSQDMQRQLFLINQCQVQMIPSISEGVGFNSNQPLKKLENSSSYNDQLVQLRLLPQNTQIHASDSPVGSHSNLISSSLSRSSSAPSAYSISDKEKSLIQASTSVSAPIEMERTVLRKTLSNTNEKSLHGIPEINSYEEANGEEPHDEQHDNETLDSVSTPEGVHESPIPNLLHETGKYGFTVILDDKEDTVKTPTWLLSPITKKLYTNMNKAIPFRVQLKKSYSSKKFFLRAMAVFKYPMFLRQNVVRCPNHSNPLDPLNADFSHPNHVIRADHPTATYSESPSGRLSVSVPLDFPENRCETIPVLLKFMCHNSCVGGINRRPMAVLLTLEHMGVAVGRYTVDVRVCACPSRDVKTEESAVISRTITKKCGTHLYERRRGRKRPKYEFTPKNEASNSIFYLPVCGRKLYHYLQDMKVLYLKSHPEYAKKYPDPPPNCLGYGADMEDHDQLVESRAPSESPPNANSQSPLNVGDVEGPYLFLNTNGINSYPSNEHTSLSVESNHHSDNEPNDEDYCFTDINSANINSTLETMQNNLMHESSLIIDESNSFSLQGSKSKQNFIKIPVKKNDGMSLSHHLQVAAMPTKQGLISPRHFPKYGKSTNISSTKFHDCLSSQSMRDSPSSQEMDESVMLAAQVLASNLGSRSMNGK